MTVTPVEVDNFRSRMVSGSNLIDNAVRPETASFEQTLLAAFDRVNEKQIATDNIAQQLIVDPESVDVHDVTIAMAHANLSLKIAQTVIDRVIKGWNEITTSR
ncbi:flagellar hook-basal body complex protein FliE [Brucepastera parasyntrophica]|uniref:flagellar hook-basal body complex protein FliE n=1 Tax=Brucepastera parasyntrophica TaxID=2880008 RepID=UPI002109A062|nr:flagellar hook-basal body complex protein FliE [Brucepastera parasyntrophica]ULQ60158.1 flagellar hook-basal body complex protein FliE [Brucepastera parasyntrophica]